jgi:hypothetical protein
VAPPRAPHGACGLLPPLLRSALAPPLRARGDGVYNENARLTYAVKHIEVGQVEHHITLQERVACEDTHT